MDAAALGAATGALARRCAAPGGTPPSPRARAAAATALDAPAPRRRFDDDRRGARGGARVAELVATWRWRRPDRERKHGSHPWQLERDESPDGRGSAVRLGDADGLGRHCRDAHGSAAEGPTPARLSSGASLSGVGRHRVGRDPRYDFELRRRAAGCRHADVHVGLAGASVDRRGASWVDAPSRRAEARGTAHRHRRQHGARRAADHDAEPRPRAEHDRPRRVHPRRPRASRSLRKSGQSVRTRNRSARRGIGFWGACPPPAARAATAPPALASLCSV